MSEFIQDLILVIVTGIISISGTIIGTIIVQKITARKKDQLSRAKESETSHDDRLERVEKMSNWDWEEWHIKSMIVSDRCVRMEKRFNKVKPIYFVYWIVFSTCAAIDFLVTPLDFLRFEFLGIQIFPAILLLLSAACMYLVVSLRLILKEYPKL